jgi:hypothetical protein
MNNRPSGIFYCPQYSAAASWKSDIQKIVIDWKNFGQYELNIVSLIQYLSDKISVVLK